MFDYSRFCGGKILFICLRSECSFHTDVNNVIVSGQGIVSKLMSISGSKDQKSVKLQF